MRNRIINLILTRNQHHNVLTTEDVGQHGVSHDGLTELHPLLVVEVHKSVADGYQSVWPRQTLVLFPPSLHHVAHVESQEERHLFGHRTEVLVKIINELLELLPLVVAESSPGGVELADLNTPQYNKQYTCRSRRSCSRPPSSREARDQCELEETSPTISAN